MSKGKQPSKKEIEDLLVCMASLKMWAEGAIEKVIEIQKRVVSSLAKADQRYARLKDMLKEKNGE